MTTDLTPEIAGAPIEITMTPGAIHIVGEIDASSCGIVRDAIAAADFVGAGPIHLDMSRVEFMDSAGIGVLIESFKSRSEGVVVLHPSPSVERILQLTGLYARFVGERNS